MRLASPFTLGWQGRTTIWPSAVKGTPLLGDPALPGADA
jgi:hypothetical protein